MELCTPHLGRCDLCEHLAERKVTHGTAPECECRPQPGPGGSHTKREGLSLDLCDCPAPRRPERGEVPPGCHRPTMDHWHKLLRSSSWAAPAQYFKLKVHWQGSQRLGGGCSLRRAVPHSGSEAVRRSVIEACKSVPEKGCGALARTFAPVAPTPWMSVTLTPFPLSRTPSPPPSVPPCAFRPRTRSRVHIQIGRHPTGGLLNHSAGHGIGVRGSGVSHVGVRGLGRGKDPLRLRAFVAELRP